MKMRPFVAVVLLLSSLLAVASAAGKKDRCHTGDKVALLAVKAAFGNQFPSWMNDTSCCEWYGVDCDPFTGRVMGLSFFQDASLTGTIPDAIDGLTHLQNLMLHHLPAFSGPIPASLAKLTNLSFLTISYTGVSGPVPSFLGALTKLTFLDLSFNALSGAIPASIAGIASLSGINLSRNRLTGAIPPLLFSKDTGNDQVYLVLSHNNLTGGVPAGFAAVRFGHVDLSRNALTGDASALFGVDKALEIVDLSRNAFNFNLSGVGLPERLGYMDVSHNAIYGGIPPQVANLTNLQQFNVSYNRLCGEVPTGGNMARFDAYNYQHNKCLCGAPLPPCK
ncbi:hypothetical protein EJB05_34528, partial [Eragrostis curvula]